MSVQYDSTPRAVEDASNVATTLGAASLGGTIGVRVIVDDAVMTSKAEVLRHIDTVVQVITEQTWPAA